MNKLTFILLSIAALSCGDNAKAFDDAAAGPKDGSGGSNFPAAPTLGTQIDRLGRPAINTVLNHLTDTTAAAGTAKDAYNGNGDPSTWASYATEFAKNLAVLDSLDGTCGNQVFYNGMPGGGGTDTAMSYATLATVLTDDELYLDSTKMGANLATTNQNYLAAELNAFASVPNTTCGGRAPLNDVIDTSYTALAVGIAGFTGASFDPAVKDTVGPHADVSDDTFPFFGTPHT